MPPSGFSFDDLSTVTIADLYSAAESQDDSIGSVLRDIRATWATEPGRCVIAGGLLRSLVIGEPPRDIDVITLGPIPPDTVAGASQNAFRGYKLSLHKVSVDLWSVNDTWAVKEGLFPPTAEGLIKSFFFNSEAVAIDPYNHQVVEAGFIDALRNGKLEILSSRPPFPPPRFQVMRAAVLCGKYGWRVGPKLREFIKEANSAPNEVWSLHRRYYGKTIISNQFVEDFLTRL